MNPEALITPQIVDICSKSKTTIICGFTKTGKITIAKKLAKELNRKLFISDDYQFVKPEESLYVFMEDILSEYEKGTPIIVEGILCFRLLRKGIQLNNFSPDLILKTKCSENTIRHFYKKDGEEHKANRAISFNKGLDKIWNDYLSLLYSNPQIKRPGFIELNTSLY